MAFQFPGPSHKVQEPIHIKQGGSLILDCLSRIEQTTDFATLNWPTCARLIWPTLIH